ncbi:MAG: DUF1273 family protein [Clostridia bacterium]|nr:DUF1273 family protein [Clostridia bacterium]
MSELMLNPAKSVALTGHRKVDLSLDIDNLKKVFLGLIDKGFENFFIGMAVGFDTIAFNVLEDIRKQKDIKLIACIPCPEQAKNFDYKEKAEYDRMLESANEKVILSPHYTKLCFINRNRYMVDNSSVLVAYVREKKGGSYQTKLYAKKKGITIIEV